MAEVVGNNSAAARMRSVVIVVRKSNIVTKTYFLCIMHSLSVVMDSSVLLLAQLGREAVMDVVDVVDRWWLQVKRDLATQRKISPTQT